LAVAFAVAFAAGLALAPSAAASQSSAAGDGQAPAGVGPHTWTVSDLQIETLTGPDDDIPVTLDASLWLPDGASPASPMPAMLVAPGFGNTKDAAEMVTLAAYFASHGYVTMTFTPQGFGASTGCIGLDSRTYDNKNARAMIDHLASLDVVATEAPGDPKVGMVGGSYGGGLQGHTAVADARIDAIAPGRTWTDLAHSLNPNNWVRDADAPYAVDGYEQGVFKQGWTSLFFALGSAQPAQGGGGCDPVTRQQTYPTATPCSAWIPGICETFARLSTTGDASEEDRALVADSSLAPELGQLTTPTLWPQGLPDTLFTPNETAPVLIELQRRGVPVAVIWHSSGHGGYDGVPGDGEPYTGQFDDSPERQAEFAQTYLARRTLAWMQRHVRGDASVDTGPAFAYFRGWVDYDVAETGGTAAPAYGTADRIPPADDLHLVLDPAEGRLVEVGEPMVGGSATFLNPPGGTPAAYSELPNFSSPGDTGDRPPQEIEGQHLALDTGPFETPLDLVGIPFLDLHLSHINTVRDARLFAKLYDVAPDGTATLLRRQVAPARIPTEALTERVTLRLVGTSWRFEEGHRLRLVLAATDMAFYNERLADVLTVSSTADAPSVLRLPVMGATPSTGETPDPPAPVPTAPAPAPLPATGGGAVVAGLALLLTAGRRRRDAGR
jgi:ABC-2 type transport system ATP-binding protein